MKTAEWQCTSCGTTNRALVADDVTHAEDRCITCRTRHLIEEDPRPVRWRAAPKR
jgi:DNA-directed RNA polymerase subunit RPC12/RpoP